MTPWFSSYPSSTTSAAQGSDEQLSVAAVVKLLNPPKQATNVRFSSLLLEYGETLLQDWAVVLSTSEQDAQQPLSSAAAAAAAGSKAGAAQWNKSGRHQSSSSSLNRSSITSKPQQQKWSKLQGRLHLCTKSLVFEPQNVLRPILRFPFSKMESPPKEGADMTAGTTPQTPNRPGATTTSASNLGDSYELPLTIQLQVRRYFSMKENNVIGPITSVEVSTAVQFTFLHSNPKDYFCELCQKLYSNPSPDELEEQIVKPMLYRTFGLEHLVHMHEVPATPSLRANVITPLQKKPGSLLLTTERAYFQTATLAEEGGLVTTWMLANAVAYARRYAGLKDCAVELYWKDGTSTLLALERSREREKVITALLRANKGGIAGAANTSTTTDRKKRNLRCLTDREFVVEAYEAWSNGTLTNFDYLMAVNAAAGRTFHDLSRYPVFPWVLADYSSDSLDLNNPKTFRDLTKPMGALNATRLEYFETRLRGMEGDMDEDQAFLYGTHYSAPGYILYYLVRSMPQHMLCLQNGKFDAPDRLFHSINQCWDCALTNHADVKELIPQFYMKQDFEFLINAQSLQLGATQLGDRVHDVSLPPWAKQSPRTFLKQMRKALESKHVSAQLPQWIDLLFGIKSRGKAALEAQNLFHPTAYLGPDDLADMTDFERFQAELQSAEFGIVPDQLFDAAHPLKGAATSPEEFISAMMGKVSHDLEGEGLATDSESKQEAWELLEPPSSTASQDDDGVASGAAIQHAGSHDESDEFKASIPVGFGSTMMVPPKARLMEFSSKLSPLRKRVSKDDDEELPTPNELVTPGGKAKASWVSSNLSVPQDDGTPVDTQPINYRGQQTVEQPDLMPVMMQPMLEGASSPQRTIGFSGSGELSSNTRGKADMSFGGMAPGRNKNPNQPLTPNRNSPKINGDFRTGWDMKMLEKERLHSDAVSGCALLFHDGASYVTSVSLDGSMLVHSINLAAGGATSGNSTFSTAEDLRKGLTGTLSRFYAGGAAQAEKAQPMLTPFRRHTASDPLACLSLTDDGYGGYLVFAGGHDDVVCAYGINSACAVASVYSHRDAVTGLDVIARSPLNQTSALWPSMATHIMVSGSWDATVKVWSVAASAGETVSINREPLAELFDADSTIVCLSATYVSGIGVAICTGCSDGSFVVWLCHDDGTKVVIHKEMARRGAGPCAAVKWTKEHGETFLFAGFASGRLSSFLLAGGSLIKVSAVSVGVSVTCIEYAEGTLLVGCADGGLRLLPIRDGASFDGKPTLWNAVNGKSSPGLTCSSIGFTEGRFLCSTGAEDGSVAIFELKKAK